MRPNELVQKLVGLEELVKNVRQLLRRDARPGIRDRDHDIAIVSRHRKRHLSAPVGELEGVREKVAKHFVDAVFIPESRRWKTVAVVNCKRYVALRGQHGKRALQGVEEAWQIHLPHIELATTRLEAADVQQALDQPRQGVCLLVDGIENLFLFRRQFAVDSLSQQLQIADDDVDRCLELVGGYSNEFRTETLQL